MKKYSSDTAKPYLFVHDILFRTAGILFFLTMLSVWIVCGLYAKYVVKDSGLDSARVAAFALIELKEHEAVLENGEYHLLNDEANSTDKSKHNEVNSNTYKKVIPGVDIPKDPFIRINKAPEAACAVYIQVNESNKFPSNFVEYEIDDKYWEIVDKTKKIYKYKENISPNTPLTDTIPILKKIGDSDRDGVNDRELKVSEKYVGIDGDGNPIDFSLSFNAWLVQID